MSQNRPFYGQFPNEITHRSTSANNNSSIFVPANNISTNQYNQSYPTKQHESIDLLSDDYNNHNQHNISSSQLQIEKKYTKL